MIQRVLDTLNSLIKLGQLQFLPIKLELIFHHFLNYISSILQFIEFINQPLDASSHLECDSENQFLHIKPDNHYRYAKMRNDFLL